MTWIEGKTEFGDDGDGAGGEWRSNSSGNSQMSMREGRPARNCSHLKRSLRNNGRERTRRNIRGGEDNDRSSNSSNRPGIETSFGGVAEPNCADEGWESCGEERSRSNGTTLNELCDGDDLSTIFLQKRFSGSAAFNTRKWKCCNELSSPMSSSSSTSTSTCSPSPATSWLLFLLVFSWNLSSTSSFCPPYCSCDDIALSVDCHHSASNLRVVPIFLNPQIKFLSLSKNQIKDITMSLQFYSELQVLDISHNRLDSLGKTNFESLRHLHLLNVSYNAIKSLENGVFTGLTHLRTLDLSGNQLEKVDREIFSSLSSVREIVLDRNRLEVLDWDLFLGLDTLERISAKFNFIQVIEPSVSFSLRSGSGASAGESSPVISNSSSGNNLASFWTLKSVHYLDISSNQLTRVKDYGLVMFSALRELNLCCNYIHTLEERAFSSSSLHPARKSSNSNSGHLERLNLSQNRLGRVPTEALEKVGSTLRQLDLSSNRISDHIPKNAFRALVHLESVRLSDNPEILYIEQDALSENINLISFEADYLSNLTEISPTLLRNKMFLENFSLKYASISSLSPEFFQPPVADIVGCVDLTGNPVDCNCSAHSFYEFVTENLGAAYPSSSDYFPEAPYNFDQSLAGDGLADGKELGRDENNNLIQEHAFPHSLNQPDGASNFSTASKSESLLASHSNPNLISHQSTHPSRSASSPTSASSSRKKTNLSNSSKNMKTRPNLLYVRCQSPPALGGVLMKDLKPADFQHCFVADDQFEIMVICTAGGILSLIFLTLAIKLCCVCGAGRRLSSFCKSHCSATNCCHKLSKSRKEKKQSSSDKLFFDSMTIALRRDMGVPLGTTNGVGVHSQPPNFTSNGSSIVPNGKSILGGELLYCGNGIPLTTSGCIIGGGSATLGRNGNGNHNHPITMSMDYDDCYQDDEDDDEEQEEDEREQHNLPHHRSQHHFGQLERSYAPVEPPPPIPTTPIPLQFPNQVQSLSRKQQKQLLLQQHHLHAPHQHHSPSMGYSPKHYSQHNVHNHHPHQHHHHLSSQHSSPKHSSQQQQQHNQQSNPPVIVHYEYPDFPSMHRVKQVPSVLV